MKPALVSAKRVIGDMNSIVKLVERFLNLEAYDWRFYFEKAMAMKFNLSDAELRPYFQTENVRDGNFYVANLLNGITFEQIENVHFLIRKLQLLNVKMQTELILGILFMDMFARPGAKRGGAWCSGFRSQSYKDGQSVAPIVTIVGNFT